MTKMEKEFWENRWKEKETGWDIGYASPAIKKHFETITDFNVKILIPGCGNAYEAEEIYNLGFHKVYVVDISVSAVASFKKRCPNFPENQIICDDFFSSDKLDEIGPFDFIIEQTFFCAIQPDRRDDYCARMKQLIQNEGHLVGLMFNFPLESGPPFGGSKEEYLRRFNANFEVVDIIDCENSIHARQGREYWINIAKPKK